MKFIITESQNRRLRLIRRTERHPRQYVLDYIRFIRNICRFGSFGRFINHLQEDVRQEWMESEDMDYIRDYIGGEMYEELKSYYESECAEKNIQKK